MGLDYGIADRESQSDAFSFCGEEWLEDAADQLRLNGWPSILDLDQNTIWLLGRPDQNFPPPVGGRARCFNRIHNQVNQYLRQQHRVAGYGGQVRGHFGAQGHTVSRELFA